MHSIEGSINKATAAAYAKSSCRCSLHLQQQE